MSGFLSRTICGEISPDLTGRNVNVVIWTTTPWTLPANLAIALHPDFVYAAVESATVRC
jgi:isoleucyl-tRNA synthetase